MVQDAPAAKVTSEIVTVELTTDTTPQVEVT